jgi:hypothetical protein
VVVMAVGSVEAYPGGQTVAAGDIYRRGGRDGRRSGPGKVDDDTDEARGRDGRILVWRGG